MNEKIRILIFCLFLAGNLIAQNDTLQITPLNATDSVRLDSSNFIQQDSLHPKAEDSVSKKEIRGIKKYFSERYTNLVFDNRNVYATRKKNFSLSAGFLYATDKHARSLPEQTEGLNSNYYAAPYETGKMGLTYGFSIKLDLKWPLNFINKNLSRKTQFSLLPVFNYSLIQFNWKGMTGKSPEIERYFEAKQNYKSFNTFGAGIGLMFTYIPDTKPNKSEITWDFYASLFGTLIEKGGFVYRDKMNIYTNAAPIVAHPSFGTRLKFMKDFYLMAEYNSGIKIQNKKNTHNYIERVFENGTYTSNTVPLSDKLKLNNLVVGIGFYF